MNFEKDCSAIVYRMKHGYPEFLVEYRDEGRRAFLPARVMEKDNKNAPDRVEVRGGFTLEVKLDIVFREELRRLSAEDPARYIYAAEAKQNGGEPEDPDTEDYRLKWSEYEWLTGRMADPADEEILKHLVSYLFVKHNMRNPVEDPGFILYREHGVDIHSHIIPGADDGSQSEEETAELLRLAREEGIQWVFATPHYGKENGYAPHRDQIHSGLHQLSDYMLLSSCPSKVMLGTEWYCSDDIVNRIRNREAFPMGDSDWYMVEFLEWRNEREPADVILRRLKHLKDNHIKTILAHPERYRAIKDNLEISAGGRTYQGTGVLDILLQNFHLMGFEPALGIVCIVGNQCVRHFATSR